MESACIAYTANDAAGCAPRACDASARRAVRVSAFFALALVFLAFALSALCAYYPVADGKTLYYASGFSLDASHATDGYIMVKFKGASNKKIKMRITIYEEQYTYDLTPNADFVAFPLQFGTGTYNVKFFKQVSGTKYTQEFAKNIKVTIKNTFSAFLYPNQYAWYTKSSKTVKKSNELCKGLKTDREKFNVVFDYVKRTLFYDYFTALSVQSGYLPDVDKALEKKKGICFDYAAVMACMLRVQNIPVKLCIGYADKTYHAWNSVYLDGEWKLCDATFAVTGAKPKAYTLSAVY